MAKTKSSKSNNITWDVKTKKKKTGRTAMQELAIMLSIEQTKKTAASLKKKRATNMTMVQAVNSMNRNIASWGNSIYFEVCDKRQVTFNNLSMSHSARWKEHEIVGHKPLSEFTGADLTQLTMSCVFSVALGLKPKEIKTALKNLKKALDEGTVDYLYISGKKVGSYKMRLTSMSESWDTVMIDGTLVRATVDLTFQEYVTKSYKHGKNVAGTKVPWEFLVGEKPKFTGGKVYKTSNATKGRKESAVKVEVTKFQEDKKHPYYVKSIVDKNAAEKYTKEIEEIQKKIKTAGRTEKKRLQENLESLKEAAKVNSTVWKGWVDDGTLKA